MASKKFSIMAVFEAVDKFTGPMRSMSDSVDRFTTSANKKLDSFGERIGKVNEGFAAIGKSLAVAGAGAGFLGREVLKGGGDFEQAMANVGAVSLMTRSQVKDLEAGARSLGLRMKFSATEVANGMELMGKAGFDNGQILKGIPDFLNAAAAEGAEFEETAGVLSNVMKGMGLDVATETKRVADVLTLASARTNSSITSLGESMKNASPVARTFGVSFEDAVSAVALLQDVGLDASEAGSATATMLTNLSHPSKKAAAEMHRLGISFQDAKGNMKPLSDVFGQMAKAAGKSGGNMKTVAFFAELVGLRGQKAALNLQELFKSGKFASLTDELHAANGEAEKMASLRMDTVQGDLKILGNTVEDLKISLFDTQSGPLRDVIQSMNLWVLANRELITQKVQDTVMWIADNMSDIVKWGTRIAYVVGTFWALEKATSAVRIGIEAFSLAHGLIRGIGVAVQWSAGRMAFFGMATSNASAALSGMRAALNANMLAQGINGVTSTLGKAGLLGAAGAVGYMFGSWLNDTFKISDAISDIIAKVTGLSDRGGGSATLDPSGVQVLADGTEMQGGKIVKKGSDWERIQKKIDARNRGIGDQMAAPLRGVSESVASSDARARVGTAWGNAPQEEAWRFPVSGSRVVSPQEVTARTIVESTQKTSAEITVRAEPGTSAEVTKKPRAAGLRMRPSGAF